MGKMTEHDAFLGRGSGDRDSEKYLQRGNFNSFEFTDKDIAKQFFSIPFQDRNAMIEEIHGVGTMAVEETPQLIEESLMMLEKELYNLPSPYKEIYLKACTMDTCFSNNKNGGSDEDLTDVGSEEHFLASGVISNQNIHPSSTHCDPDLSCYVKSRNFQLAFLRSEFFDAKKAAIRLTKYLELAQTLYGDVALRRPLRIDDFKSREESDVINAGHTQLLPFRDRSGRRVLAIHGNLSLPKTSLMARSVLSKGPAMKLTLYMWSILLEDVDVQRKGLVVIFWPRYVDPDRVEPPPEPDTEEAPDPLPKTKRRRKRRPRRLKNTHVIDDKTGFGQDFVPDADSTLMGIKFFEAVPVRISAMHICLPDTPFFRMIRHITQFILGESFRTRVKTHQGE